MLATEIDIGPNLLAVALASIAAAGNIVTLILQARTRKEMKPNGGSSMRDAVDRIEAAVARRRAADKEPAIVVVEASPDTGGSTT
jgi:hypothetical protein